MEKSAFYRIAYFPGSFDPFTLGHLDLLAQCLNVADRVVVGVGVHPGKTPLFDFDERAALVRQSAEEFELDTTRLGVEPFRGLVVDAAQEAGASIIIRGVRDANDLPYEMQMAGMNGTLAPGLQTVFLPASPETRFITGTLVRQIASMRGNIEPFVSAPVAQALEQRFAKPN
ncbi:MAG: pantetheine-phosphate adenylyltransferase [Pseudomonadota bacterium]